ncbi:MULTISPECIES: TetR/AcrR family transcriptional regulator [Microbacterium]|uniref:TetR/AcrR family transcriptional regulator n=1 Tax=Microbacterium TaxID=33882 RepID=UPI000D6510DF|nr:TetR/AcrR family transcriptional regulator [Microbacterium sp. KCTC 39802]
MASNRVRVLEAAVDLLGTGGLRALTHMRVDERAGLPKGSTSNYFRTRAALVAGVSDWIVEQELASLNVAFAPRSPEELVQGMCGLLDVITRDNRKLTTARLVLFMEASHDADLRALLQRGRGALVGGAAAALTEMGASNPDAAAQSLAATMEGLILHRIARHDFSDPRPILELVVAGIFRAPAVPSP